MRGARQRSTTTTASDSKYDVNGDGSVNNADSDAITVAIAAGATDAKYDVNGDGTVNVFDLVEIIANRDPGAAGAPTLCWHEDECGVQIDSLQEQIDLLIAMNDRSPAALRTLMVYFQQLHRDGTSRENAVACELSESVQPRNVDSV